MAVSPVEHRGRTLLQLGVVLFLLGLLTGFLLPAMENPRMGLSSHLEGVMNGMVLVGLGLLWPMLTLGDRVRQLALVLAVYGTYANWLTTLAAGFWGAGGGMMPLAAAGYIGTGVQEGLVTFGLISLSVAMVIVAAVVLWGLHRPPPTA
jgi:(hydroxyamino)benzene mutase